MSNRPKDADIYQKKFEIVGSLLSAESSHAFYVRDVSQFVKASAIFEAAKLMTLDHARLLFGCATLNETSRAKIPEWTQSL